MKTYFFYSKYFNKNLIKEIFSSNSNWKEANENDKFINFIYWDNYVDLKKEKINLDYTKSDIKIDFIEKNKVFLTNKSLLYENMYLFDKEFTQKYFMDQINLYNININSLEGIFKNKIWILKPTEGYFGSGIKIFNNFNSLKKYYNNHIIKKFEEYKKNIKKKYHTFILAEYIDNPFIFVDKTLDIKRKFNFRLYLIITNINKKLNGYLFNLIPINLAKKNYEKNNYNDNKIHITHYPGKENMYIFPYDFYKFYDIDKTKKIFDELKYISKKIFKFIQNFNLTCYTETKNCYEIFGIDILLNDNLELKILELNERIGMPIFDDYPLFGNLFLQTLINITINEFYPEKYKIKNYKNIFITNL
jgi:hypothetical protein